MGQDVFLKPGVADKKYQASLERFWKMAGSRPDLNYLTIYKGVKDEYKEFELLNQTAEAMRAISAVTTGQLPKRISKSDTCQNPTILLPFHSPLFSHLEYVT